MSCASRRVLLDNIAVLTGNKMSVPNKPPAMPQDVAPTPSSSLTGGKHGQAAPLQQALPLTPQHKKPQSRIASASQLWLCVHLPALPLEALQQTSEPFAVFDEQQGMRKVLLANAPAKALGIGPGLSVNAALALVPTLLVEERNQLRELQVLHQLAALAEKYTSFVCLAGPSLLLLEIAGSLRLFGGLKALRQRIDANIRQQGFCAAIAIAPSPLAATWFARAGARVCIRNTANLAGRLASLPLTCLDWPDAIQASLKGMGISRIGECLRLPRQGFAKRFGACRLLELDRALGKLPDPRTRFREPERFSSDYEFSEEQSNRDLLLNACEVLLEKLERFLLTRQVAVQHIQFSFFYLQNPATHLALGCAQTNRTVLHWLKLLELKLERTSFTAPVIAIRLCSGPSESFSATSGALNFSKQTKRQWNTPITHLAERLGARIGEAAVHGVMMVAEHRPKYAWQRCDAVEEMPHCAAVPGYTGDYADKQLAGFTHEIQRNNSLMLRRPLWVLQEPRLLVTEQGAPQYEGVLQLLAGPERLETGWWDEDGIARDYFVARNPQGVHFWIYRDRSRKQEWYLEGMFG